MKLKDEENVQVGEIYLSCIWPSKHDIQITKKSNASQQGETKEPAEKWTRDKEAVPRGGGVKGKRI